ncbi:flavin reductase family protein [Nocardioides caldifontis]|uniref:flavin reductase family protein n=1 Tax=Nocardioides caldifontis TaxID=2588938 RepID=UPI00193A478E|nr:flavin reductase family protein [Nocardioides caldifontis]
MTIVLPFATADEDLDPSVLRRAFGAFPSGVVAVAAEVDGRHVGMAASSFTSVSLAPALVSFCIANSSTTWPLLRRAPRLGVSVLADHHDQVCRQLSGPAEGRFQGLDLLHTDAGAVLLHEAVAGFDTSVFREVRAGDHTVVLLRLHAVTHSDDGSPLVFHRSSFGRLAG